MLDAYSLHWNRSVIMSSEQRTGRRRRSGRDGNRQCHAKQESGVALVAIGPGSSS
jgi:hypothetical protein